MVILKWIQQFIGFIFRSIFSSMKFTFILIAVGIITMGIVLYPIKDDFYYFDNVNATEKSEEKLSEKEIQVLEDSIKNFDIENGDLNELRKELFTQFPYISSTTQYKLWTSYMELANRKLAVYTSILNAYENDILVELYENGSLNALNETNAKNYILEYLKNLERDGFILAKQDYVEALLVEHNYILYIENYREFLSDDIVSNLQKSYKKSKQSAIRSKDLYRN